MKFFSRSDTIAKRLALTVLLSVLASASLYGLFVETAGVWGLPPLSEIGLEEQAVNLVRIYSAIPPDLRGRVAKSSENDRFKLQWRESLPETPETPASTAVQKTIRRLLNDPHRAILVYKASYFAKQKSQNIIFGSDAYGMAISLSDGSWLIFRVPHRSWGIGPLLRYSLISGCVLLSAGLTALLAARGLEQPLQAFAAGARRFGTDPHAPSLTEAGPQEFQAAMKSFNSMQTQIRRFVTDRTEMLAAISHDLRTPLTRVRLRGEFINDLNQRSGLFRDVDEMQAMVDSALNFFSEEAPGENSTDFVLSELLQVVADEFSDQGLVVNLDDCKPHIYNGRPFALKRAFINIVENACVYGVEARIHIGADDGATIVSIKDIGPGIPEPLLEQVFSPFFRVDRSRSRKTGGVGLGLTSARAIIRAHGGDINLINQRERGLLVQVCLPHSGSGIV